MRYLLSSLFIIVSLIVISQTIQPVYAQDPAEGLSDLVGAKAGQAEMGLKQRGYTYVKTDKSGDSSYSYWTENSTGKCVTIRTADGRYQSIVYAPEFDCKNSETAESEPVVTSVDGQCTLYNKKSDNNKYKGTCEIEQHASQNTNKYVIKFSNGQTYSFMEQSNGYQVETPEGMSRNIASMIDKGDNEVFKWGKWKLTFSAPDSASEAQSAELAGQDTYDATGDIPCAQSKGQPMGQCPFGVTREGNGTATVTVTLPDGRNRAIFFENGNQPWYWSHW